MQTEIKMTPNLFKLFEKIAAEQMSIETLETRNWDGHDFHEVAVWCIQAALKDAYDAGYHAAEKKALKAKQ